MREYSPLNIRLTIEERAIVDALAKQEGMTSSAYIKSKIELDKIKGQEEISTFPEVIKESKNKTIAINVTQSEYEELQKEAEENHTKVGTLCRLKALTTKNIIKVEIYDADIVDLQHRIQPKIDSIYGVIKALAVQKVLHETQYQKLEELLQGIYNDFRFTTKKIRQNRNSIRQTRLRELRKRCDKAITTKTDSLAKLDSENFYEE